MILTILAAMFAVPIASLLALFIFFELERKEPPVTIQEEYQLRIQGEALLEAAVDTCRKALGESASDVRLSVMHLVDGRWRLVTDFGPVVQSWTDADREVLLEKFAAGIGPVWEAIAEGKKGAAQ